MPHPRVSSVRVISFPLLNNYRVKVAAIVSNARLGATSELDGWRFCRLDFYRLGGTNSSSSISFSGAVAVRSSVAVPN